MEDILAVVFIFGGGTLFALSMSPVGRAIAHRIKRSGREVPEDVLDRIAASHQAVLDEVDALRQEVADVQERLDFAERLLTRREAGRLPGEAEQSE